MKTRPAISSRPFRILIVDDERQNRQLLEILLATEAYVLETAESGEEALAVAAREPPDLILLDVMMPGMDGYEVARQLKGNAATENIPIIMVTALDDRSARMQGLEAGAQDFLTKPVDRAELSVRVKNLLHLKAYGDYFDRYSSALEGEVDAKTAALVQSERLYRETFDAAPVGIVHIGADGRWLRVNQRLCDLLGFLPDELPDAAPRDAATVEAASFRLMAAGGLDRYVVDETTFRRKDGSDMWARVNMSVHRDPDGRFQHTIAVIEDITARRLLEAQLRQTNKMDAIGQLASGVAHDFNNLLTVITGFTELISMDEQTVSRNGASLMEITRAAQRAMALTRQLLAFGRKQVLDSQPLDVNALITEMTGMLSRLIGENVKIALVLDPGVAIAHADRGQVGQVLMNLVVNARDAMPDGGTVTVETADVELEDSSFHEQAIAKGTYVMISVTDTGTGMSKETQKHLFEPFFTTKEAGKGTGLGLSTIYGIVKQSKGYVWVYSEPGLGTTFKVYLPRAIELPARQRGQSAIRRREGSLETLLLVEDEKGVRELARRALEHAGYRLLLAEDGQEAETVFAGHEGPIALVLTDMSMPGETGLELAARLRQRCAGLRVLIMSGRVERGSAKTSESGGDIEFISKPFTAAELVRRVRGSLQEAGSSRNE